MDRVICYMLAFVSLLSLNSCIKEGLEECLTEYSVKVFVKDKNYFNIENFPQLTKKDEGLPFDQFVGTINYQLRNQKTGVLVVESTERVTTNGNDFYTIHFNNLPDGDYELSVWGNLAAEVTAGVLHGEGKEYTDLYLATKQIVFSAGSPVAELNMERTKGNLLLLCTNFPTDINEVEQQISTLYETVDPYFKYSGNTTVVKSTSVAPAIQTLLAPSANEGISKLNLRFFSGVQTARTKSIAVPEIPLTLKRNEITAVQVDYNALAGVWEIWTYIDDKWTMIQSLDIVEVVK